MAPRVGEIQREIPDHVIAEIEAQVLALAHRDVMNLVQNDLLGLGAVALLEREASDRLVDLVVERRRELLRDVQELCVVHRMKIFNDAD